MIIFKPKNEGNVLLLSIFMMSLLVVIVFSLATLTILESRQSVSINSSAQAYLAAEAGSRRAQNYAVNRTEANITGQGVGDMDGSSSSVSNQATYDLRLVQNGSSLEGSACSNDFCFASWGRANGIVRKLEGSIIIPNPNQSQWINLADSVTANLADNGSAKLLMFSPSCLPGCANYGTYIFTGTINHLDTAVNGDLFRFGGAELFGKGAGIKVEKISGNIRVSLEYVNILNAPNDYVKVNSTLGSLPDITSPPDFLYYKLVIRKGTSSSIATLTISKDDGGGKTSCVGSISGNINAAFIPVNNFYDNLSLPLANRPKIDRGNMEVDIPGDGTKIGIGAPFYQITR